MESEWEYGIIKDRYGNLKIGKYKYTKFNGQFIFHGIACRKIGFEEIAYCQGESRMGNQDYPINIPKETFDEVVNILKDAVNGIEKSLSIQPTENRRHAVNSKFIAKGTKFSYACSINNIADDGTEFYDSITIKEGDFPSLKYNSPALIRPEDYECSYIQDHIYESIMDKLEQTSSTLKITLEKEYKYRRM